jgi:hypothetical protein
MFNRNFFEAGNDIILLAGADANTDITGDWIKLRDYDRVGILLAKRGSEDVDDLGLQFLQATDASGTGSKALSLPVGREIYTKTGTLTSQTVWTRTVAAAAIDGMAFGASVPTGFTRVIADVNTSPLLLYTEIYAADLDVNSSFDWMTIFVEGDNADNACLLEAWAILQGNNFAKSVPLSSIS